MRRNLRSRLPLIAIAAVAVAVPAVALAAASSTEVHGPRYPEVNKRFTVRADGHAHRKLVLQITIHRKGKCKPTYGEEIQAGSYKVLARFVGPGDYNEKRTGLRFTGKGWGRYCSYLGRPDDLTTDPPVARSSKRYHARYQE